MSTKNIWVSAAMIALSFFSARVARTQAAGGGQAADATQGTGDVALPSFEVASIKRHPPDNGPGMRVMMGGPDVSAYKAENVTMKNMIGFAYGMKDFQMSGGPAWISSERFDINAKVEDSMAERLKALPHAEQQKQMKLMMRSLLNERCKLGIAHTTKELPVYALVLAKGGSKLKEAPAPDPIAGPPSVAKPGAGPPPGGMSLSIRQGNANVQIRALPIGGLVDWLSAQLGHQVVDQTGLTGTYDIALQFTPEQGAGGGPLPSATGDAAAADAGGTSIFTALQEQLGLRLDSTKASVDTIEIQHVEEPSEN